MLPAFRRGASMSDDHADTFVLSTPLRRAVGALILIISASLILVTAKVEWGVSWAAWVPALAACFPAIALLQSRSVSYHAETVSVRSGFLWIREWQLPLRGSALLCVPMTLWHGVILVDAKGRHWPLATWIGRRQRDTLCEWLDAKAPDGAWPRIPYRPAANDR